MTVCWGCSASNQFRLESGNSRIERSVWSWEVPIRKEPGSMRSKVMPREFVSFIAGGEAGDSGSADRIAVSRGGLAVAAAPARWFAGTGSTWPAVNPFFFSSGRADVSPTLGSTNMAWTTPARVSMWRSNGGVKASSQCTGPTRNSSEPDRVTSSIRSGTIGISRWTARSTSLITYLDVFDRVDRIRTRMRDPRMTSMID